jgi:hypothetical protein
MTQMDVKFRYEKHPSEDSMVALGKLKEVYGIRRVVFDEEWKVITVEYDATRLTVPIVEQLIRRGGIDIVEVLPLVPPQPAPAAIPAAAPAK